MALEHLQIYWWLLISVLGALLVFLLFVQGGQSMILCTRNPLERNLIINSIGKKWELTFTTLVVFGGAFFASFPLFYSTSFGGAYWLWMLILFTFVGQAVSFQYRRKAGQSVWHLLLRLAVDDQRCAWLFLARCCRIDVFLRCRV